MTEQAKTKGKEKTVEITIDGERFTAPDHKQTVRQILELAEVDPNTHYLVEIKGGREQHSYQGEPDQEITLHKGSEFLTVPIGDTTVS